MCTSNHYLINIFPVEAPDYDELIKAIMSLENSASSDVNVRELIASFPPEVSEVTLLSKLEDKDAAAKLAAQVNTIYF